MRIVITTIPTGDNMAACKPQSTVSVTIDEILTHHPVPTLNITRLPNVEAMEVRNSARNLHEVNPFSMLQ